MTATTNTATRSTKAASALTRNFYFLTEDGKNLRCQDACITNVVWGDGSIDDVKQDDLCSWIVGWCRKPDEFKAIEERELVKTFRYIVFKRKERAMYEVKSARCKFGELEGDMAPMRPKETRLTMLVHKVGAPEDVWYELEQVVNAKGVYTRFHLLDTETQYFRDCAAAEDPV